MATPTFEEAMAQLEQIVAQIESGEISLEESIAKYEQGTKLVSACRSMLDTAEKKIQILTETQNGELAPAGELPAQEA
ncbi:MAG: exodeoxyribonuclease VII small subunit [Phycisphaerales bacterium]|jgi:exodeoxyribonuclease VII small subunit|nr:exodeoxyribonuclease VII small subunit [Phycisphaerales bacterium]MBT7171862.1 exodeoxyribonuclease VII small subunit [Phycisphaerales bacterium]